MLGSLTSLAALAGTTVAYAALAGPLVGSLRGPLAEGDPDSTGRAVELAATVLAVSVARALAGYAHGMVGARLGQDVVRRLRERMYGHLLRIEMETLVAQRRGALASRLGTDVVHVEGLFTRDLASMVGNLLTLGGLAWLAFRLDPSLALVALAAAPPAALVSLLIARQVRRAHHAVWERHARLAARTAELCDSSLVIRSFGAEGRAVQAFGAEARRLEADSIAARRWASIGAPVVQVLGALALLGALAIGAGRLSDGSLGVETFVSFFAVIVFVYRPMQSLGSTVQHLASSLAALERVEAVFALPLEPEDPSGARDVGPLRSELRLEGVRFTYPGGTPVLDGVDLVVRPGESVAIVGSSGAGKTTLLRILLGLARAEGTVTLDGVPVHTVRRRSWRAQFAWVTQEPLVLADTVLANVALTDAAPDRERARAALDAAGASALVEQLGGLDAALVEAGRALSGGQRQRIAIARALYRESPVLVLDEATSSLDEPSERSIAETVERLMGERTVVLVSHRLATVRRADRVVVLEQGRVVQEGAPADLAEREGPFRVLFQGERPRAGEVETL